MESKRKFGMTDLYASAPVDDWFLLSIVSEDNIKLNDKELVAQHKERLRIKIVTKLITKFFLLNTSNNNDLKKIREISDFCRTILNLYAHANSFEKVRKYYNSYFLEHTELAVYRLRLMELVNCIFKVESRPVAAELQKVKTELYEPLAAKLEKISNIQQITKKDIKNGGNTLIHKKHIKDLNSLFDEKDVRPQVELLIEKFQNEGKIDTVAELNQMLANKQWYVLNMSVNKYHFEPKAADLLPNKKV